MNLLNGWFGPSGKSKNTLACHKFARWSVSILAMSGLLICSQVAFAARYVPFYLSIDGKAVLQASTGDTGRQDADTVWHYLNKLEFRPVKGYMVEADRDDPLQATLKGKVILESSYAGRVEVSELKLVREKQESAWKIATAEVERTFKSRNKPFHFLVKVDGKLVLASLSQINTVGTDEDADSIWRYLKQVEFRPINRYKVEADRDNPLQATLKGEVVIQEVYGMQYGSRADVSEFRLVRKKDNAWKWEVAPGEVERTLKIRKKSGRTARRDSANLLSTAAPKPIDLQSDITEVVRGSHSGGLAQDDAEVERRN